jgi:hypothetical protein
MDETHRTPSGMLCLATFAVDIVRNAHQFKTDVDRTLGARRELLSRFEGGFMG